MIPMPEAPSENHLFDYKTKTFYEPKPLAVDQMDSEAVAESLWVMQCEMKRDTGTDWSQSDWTQMPDSPLR